MDILNRIKNGSRKVCLLQINKIFLLERRIVMKINSVINKIFLDRSF